MLDFLERHADGDASEAELGLFAAAIRDRKEKTIGQASRASGCVEMALEMSAMMAAVLAAMAVADANPSTSIVQARDKEFYSRYGGEEFARQTSLFRDIFGNPFRPPAIDPAWLAWHGGTIPAMARSTYDDRAFDSLPILGDALEEAGCSEDSILRHCRSAGPHARGCWVVDLILGRS